MKRWATGAHFVAGRVHMAAEAAWTAYDMRSVAPISSFGAPVEAGASEALMKASTTIGVRKSTPPRTVPRTNLKPAERPMVDERPRLAASEIEEELLADLQKLPTLHDTQSVTIRPYSDPKSWNWELDRIEPEVGPSRASSPT
jgi:hypothetical protein